MKPLLAAGGLMALTLWTASAQAASPVSFGVDVGIISRDIEEEGDLITGTALGTADSTRLTARLGLEVAPFVMLFGDVGLASISIDEFDQYRSDLHVLYGGGARVILAEGNFPQRVTVYSDFTVSRLSTDDRVVICTATCNDPVIAPVETTADEEISWTEYGIGLGVTGSYENLRPYGGLHVSRLDGKDRARFIDPSTLVPVERTADIRERDTVGFFLGTDIMLDRGERSAIRIQLSGIDENALRIGYRVAF